MREGGDNLDRLDHLGGDLNLVYQLGASWIMRIGHFRHAHK